MNFFLWNFFALKKYDFFLFFLLFEIIFDLFNEYFLAHWGCVKRKRTVRFRGDSVKEKVARSYLLIPKSASHLSCHVWLQHFATQAGIFAFRTRKTPASSSALRPRYPNRELSAITAATTTTTGQSKFRNRPSSTRHWPWPLSAKSRARLPSSCAAWSTGPTGEWPIGCCTWTRVFVFSKWAFSGRACSGARRIRAWRWCWPSRRISTFMGSKIGWWKRWGANSWCGMGSIVSIDWSIDWLTDWLKVCINGRFFDWLIDWSIHRLFDWLIDGLIDWGLVSSSSVAIYCCCFCSSRKFSTFTISIYGEPLDITLSSRAIWSARRYWNTWAWAMTLRCFSGTREFRKSPFSRKFIR